jgi:hypothetical protein
VSTGKKNDLGDPALEAQALISGEGGSACHLAAHANSCACFVLARRGATRACTAALNQFDATDRDRS